MKTTLLVILTIMTTNLFAGVIESTTSGRIGRRSQNCLKFGLCLSKSKSSEDIQIRFLHNTENQTLEIRISVKELTEKQYAALIYFESKIQVQFDESISLPEQITTQLNIQKQTIPAGSYALYQREGCFCITIPINKLV